MAVTVTDSQRASAASVPRGETKFTEFVAERFRKRLKRPVEILGPLTLSVGELQANLDRAFAFCRSADDSACSARIEEFVVAIDQTFKEQDKAVSRADVRAVVRRVGYVGGHDSKLLAVPFVDGLIVLPVEDGPRSIRSITAEDSKSLSLTPSEVHALALENLRKALPPLMDVAKPTKPGQIGTMTADYFHPSRLLLHDTWQPLVTAQGGRLIVVAPTTNSLLYFSDDQPAAREALKRVAKEMAERADNPLAPEILLRWTKLGWVRAD